MIYKKTKEQILSAISKIANIDTHLIQFKELGGLTNTNYRVQIQDASYFVRIGTEYPEVFGTSTENDWHCTSLAAALTLSPKSLVHIPDERVIISEFIETQGPKTCLQNDPLTSYRVLQLLRKLHLSDIRFPNTFCPYKTIYRYASLASRENIPLPATFYQSIFPALQRLEKEYHTKSAKQVPCHLDLHRENVLYDGQRLWLIDWEYAAMADPVFDLACIASTDTFTDNQMDQFLHTYLERQPSADERMHFYFMRILADARWSLFCYLHTHFTPTLSSTYHAFAESFLYQCVDRMKIYYHLYPQ